MNAELPLDEKPAERLSTPALENLLRTRYPRDRYALFFNVPDAVGLDANRRIDAVAFGMWRSAGRRIEGFELKISRGDWLREVKDVAKADPFLEVCDFFWLVTADSSIAKAEEIPACWGWLAATKTGLRVQRPASRLPGCGEAVPRRFVLGVLRKMQDDLIKSPEVATHIEERIKEVTSRRDRDVEYATSRIQRDFDELKKRVDTFEQQSGISLESWRMRDAGKIVRQLHELGYGRGLGEVPHLLEGHENALRITLDKVREVRAALAALPQPTVDETED
jgi:hypothetical protein